MPPHFPRTGRRVAGSNIGPVIFEHEPTEGSEAYRKARCKQAYAGLTPKIARPGGSTTNFLLQTEKDYGVAGLINLFGIESPGLTASLSIADWLAPRLTTLRTRRIRRRVARPAGRKA
jgi:L-2-hydroxyglutarate oxidase LhgO